jgi:hypothetical protein
MILPRSCPGDEKFVQLLELLAHPTLHPLGGTVEGFLRKIEFVEGPQRLIAFFLEVDPG